MLHPLQWQIKVCLISNNIHDLTYRYFGSPLGVSIKFRTSILLCIHWNRPISQIPECIYAYPTMHHFVTKMCTCVHISVTKWCIVGYGTDAFWDLWDGSIEMWYWRIFHHCLQMTPWSSDSVSTNDSFLYGQFPNICQNNITGNVGFDTQSACIPSTQDPLWLYGLQRKLFPNNVIMYRQILLHLHSRLNTWL